MNSPQQQPFVTMIKSHQPQIGMPSSAPKKKAVDIPLGTHSSHYHPRKLTLYSEIPSPTLSRPYVQSAAEKLYQFKLIKPERQELGSPTSPTSPPPLGAEPNSQRVVFVKLRRLAFLFRYAMKSIYSSAIRRNGISAFLYRAYGALFRRFQRKPRPITMETEPLLDGNTPVDDNENISMPPPPTRVQNRRSKETPATTDSLLSTYKMPEVLRMYDTHMTNLVLDLDETLVHCNERRLSDQALEIHVETAGATERKRLFLHQRSNLSRFLNLAAQHFNLIIFTAGTKEYAEEVLISIDPYLLVKQLFSRSTCLVEGKTYVKDLGALGLDLTRTIFVDNTPAVVAKNHRNAILIKDYFGGTDDASHHDNELLRLLPTLIYLSKQSGNLQPLIADFAATRNYSLKAE